MYKYKFEDTAKIGDKIRAYDFVPRADRGDYYIEGIVTDKGSIDSKDYLAYKINVTKVVRDNKDVTKNSNAKVSYVPFETDTDNLDEDYYPYGEARIMNIA